MKYEFGDERAKRKKRNRVIAIIASTILAIMAGLGYAYFSEKNQTTGDIQPVVTEIQEKTEKTIVETKPQEDKEKGAKQAKQKTEENKPVPAYTIVIDKSDFSLTVKKDDKIEKVYEIAIGKNSGQKEKVGDMRTPTGEFVVDEILDASYWKHDFKDGKGEIEGAYGPWFISLVTGWDGIGIHGTHDPASIKTMVSEGCIRMNNADVEELKAKTQVGTKVIIQE